MKRLFIGIDIGTSLSKGIILDCDGHILNQHSVRHNYCKDIDLSATWWNETCEIIRAITKDINKDLLESITITAMAPNLVFLGRNGDLIGKTRLFTDEFALGIQQMLDGQDGTKWMNETISKLIEISGEGWNWDDVLCILTTHSYISYRLSGVLYCDKATAYEYGHVFSPESNQWNQKVLSNYGIDVSLFPPIIPPARILGTILPQVANELGVPSTVKIVAGTHDSIASIVGSGLQQKGDVFLYYGTYNCSAVIHCDVSDILDGSIDCSPIEWTVSIPAAGPQFDQMCGIFVAEDAYQEFEKCAMNSICGANGVIFFQHDCLFKTSIGSQPRGGFFNISLGATKNDMCRAVFEAFPYALAACWKVARCPIPQQCYIAGGGAQSEFRVQLISDILNIRQIKLDHSENAVGTALLGVFASNKDLYCTIQNKRKENARAYLGRNHHADKIAYSNNADLFYKLITSNILPI